MTLSTAGDKTVATDDGSIENQLIAFVDAIETVLKSADASEERINAVETVDSEVWGSNHE